MNEGSVTVTRIGSGTFKVEHDGRNEIVYLAGSATDCWIFWNGLTFRRAIQSGDVERAKPLNENSPVRAAAAQTLTAPMPARVLKVMVEAGSAVKKGDTLVVLEAMKMELPVRAPANAVVAAVQCREGELVQADAVLIELRPT